VSSIPLIFYALFVIVTPLKWIGSSFGCFVRSRRLPAVEMTSLFHSPTLILYRRFVDTFHPSLTVQKLFECNDLARNLAFGFQTLGVLTLKCNFISTQPQTALPSRIPCRLSLASRVQIIYALDRPQPADSHNVWHIR
jgi:hypothetical protein